MSFSPLVNRQPPARPPDEHQDLRTEAGKFFDLPDVWMHEPSIELGGLTPAEAVADGREEDARNILRIIKYVGMS